MKDGWRALRAIRMSKVQTEPRAEPASPLGRRRKRRLGGVCHLCKLVAVSRAWRNILRAAYPGQRIRWRQIFGAYVAGTGVNALIPARGGDVVRLFLAKRRIEGSTYTTLVSTSLLQTLFD